MGGCTSCSAKTGCDDRKGSMLEQVGAALDRLYPTRTWGEPDDRQRFQAGICEHDGEALATELAIELEAPTFYLPGDDDEYCDYIYVLCVGREPSLVRLRDGGVAIPEELAGQLINELYLRVCLSGMARLAGVQQVQMTMDENLVVRESPRPGVYDPVLLSRLQRVVAVLPAYDITHLDFGEISAPPDGFLPGDYESLYGSAPHVANYLFYPQPSNVRTTTVLSREPP